MMERLERVWSYLIGDGDRARRMYVDNNKMLKALVEIRAFAVQVRAYSERKIKDGGMTKARALPIWIFSGKIIHICDEALKNDE